MFGGRQVEITEVPWQVSLLQSTTSSSRPRVRIGYVYYYSICGGAIISNTKVISTAGCLMQSGDSLRPVDQIKVIAGHFSITSAKQTVGVEKYVLHP